MQRMSGSGRSSMGVAQVALAGYGDADAAVEGPAARGTFGVSGAGIKFGILSDSVNVLGGEAADIAEGLLPAGGVTVLKEGPAGATDEGRALAQLVHATAPGRAALLRHRLRDARGVCRQHLGPGRRRLPDHPRRHRLSRRAVLPGRGPDRHRDGGGDRAPGVDYFSAAGNEDDGFYQGAWPRGGAVTQTVTVPAYVPVTLALQWDAPV